MNKQKTVTINIPTKAKKEQPSSRNIAIRLNSQELNRLDRLIVNHGYSNRSEYIRLLINQIYEQEINAN